MRYDGQLNTPKKIACGETMSFHTLFCDAPYEMNFMGKDWDEIVGIEIAEEYSPIAETRIEYL